MDQSASRTDPRIVRTRRLLRDAFVELLEEMDVDKISVNRLAELATINRVTFYLHYRDIPDMMEKMADDMIEELGALLREPEVADAPEPPGVWPQMQKLLEHIADHARFYKVILAKKRTTVFTDRMLQLLTGIVTERVDREISRAALSRMGVQRDVAIWYGASALIGTIVSWLSHDMPYTPQFLAKQFLLLKQAHTRAGKP